ncbi:hypothetical protein GJ744_002522 [Endocarpon pusillum]|uniref:PAS domain-containing protein n=1 Tax=Endocarpon pusillum TaxID=364733 RepID=A0A8H7DYS2_9EURO|nr:hypothetical protein GJ744_002522 [Endocarpon pusillum]
MSNVGALHAFPSNKPLHTIEESGHSDYEPTERGDSRLQEYEDIYYNQAVRLAAEEWQASASDNSSRSDEGPASPRADARSRLGQLRHRTNSNKQAPFQESEGSDHASAQRSSPRESGTFSVEESNTDVTSTMQQSLRGEPSDNDNPFVAPSDEFDLAAPIKIGSDLHALEALCDLLFAGEHLKKIFADPSTLLDFTAFLSACRPRSIPMLMYHLDAADALKAVNYAITIADSLEAIPGHDFTSVPTKTSMNSELEFKADKAFNVLVKEDLPAFVTQLYVQTVKSSMMRRITGPAVPPSRDEPEGMLEVFCLTDPSRTDNPIVFASKAFHQMTQYSMGYVIGRNCRFLQGPRTNKASIDRIRKALDEGRDHCDLILNYRRDGSPFLNVLMLAQLRDVSGKIRYTLGAQIDVSNVLPDSADLDGAVPQRGPQIDFMGPIPPPEGNKPKDTSQDPREMVDSQNQHEDRGRRAPTIQEQADDDTRSTNGNWQRPTALLRGLSSVSLSEYGSESWVNNKLGGFYQHYLLIRPYPSLRVLFASPSLRLPGIVQAPIIDKIGGSPEVREELTQALAQGRSVTAKVRWVMKPGDRGRNRWIAFTPLVGSHDQIGVWIAILVDEESENELRLVPPVKFRVPELKRPATAPPKAKDRLPDAKAIDAYLEKPMPPLPERRVPSRNEESPAASISPTATSFLPEIDEAYESLEVRLRKKRERDAARLLEKNGAPIKPTYKSLSPYAFMNNDGP